jgi:hypothetical protein
VISKYGHVRFGQAKSSVCIPLGAPRRLFTSHQGRTGRGAGSTVAERGREATGWTIAWGAWFEKTIDHGVCPLRSQMREAKLRPCKVPKPCQAKEEEVSQIDKIAKRIGETVSNYPPSREAVPRSAPFWPAAPGASGPFWYNWVFSPVDEE